MGRARRPGDEEETLGQFMERLGSVPLDRVLMWPAPGTATEDDLLRVSARGDRLYELVEGVLVEKAGCTPGSLVGGIVGRLLGNYVDEHDLGVVLPADAMLRLAPGLVRLPDVCFISWDHWPEGDVEQIASVYPDLAVEVVSPSNTRGEIQRKLRDYFLAGTRLAWIIQPKNQTAEIYTAPDVKRRVTSAGLLDAAPVIPGLRLAMADIFARTKRRKPGP